MLTCICGFAQEGLYRFYDYPISTIDIQTDNDASTQMSVFIRKIDINSEIKYYCILKATLTDAQRLVRSSHVTMLSYEDLKKINSALALLISEEENVWKSGVANIDYAENKYVTENGFKIGFCVNKGRLEWFVETDYFEAVNGWNVLDRANEHKAFMFNNGDLLKTCFSQAQEKIESFLE